MEITLLSGGKTRGEAEGGQGDDGQVDSAQAKILYVLNKALELLLGR